MGRYFNVTVKPTIKASDQANDAFSAHDLLFDWASFDMPKGGAALKGVTVLIRGVDGAAQTARDLTLFFATPSIDGTAPTSLGAEHATLNGVGYFNNLIGAVAMDANDNAGSLDFTNIMSTGGGAGADQIPFTVIEGRPNLTKNGYNKVYLGGAAGASNTWSFSTNVLTTGAHDVSGLSAATIASLDDGSGGDALATTKFAVGDIIHAQDDIILGEIASIDSDASLTFKADGSVTESGTDYTVPADLAAWKIQNSADAAGDLANNDELYNINPITIILHFEK